MQTEFLVTKFCAEHKLKKKSVGWSPLHAQEKRMWSIENSCGSGELSSFFAVPSRVLPAVAYSTWIWRY
jgi:hypothetical protein